jgi:DNA-binding transcriptional LysR family regulator
MPVLFGRHCIQPILLDLAIEHPGLELDLRFSDHVVDIVHDGYDLVIRNHSPGAGRGFASRLLARQHKVVCASPDYLDRRGTPIQVEDIPAHDALVYWHKGHQYPWTFRAADGAVIEAELAWRLQFDNYEALTDAALKGMGLACLPDWLVREPCGTGGLSRCWRTWLRTGSKPMPSGPRPDFCPQDHHRGRKAGQRAAVDGRGLIRRLCTSLGSALARH